MTSSCLPTPDDVVLNRATEIFGNTLSLSSANMKNVTIQGQHLPQVYILFFTEMAEWYADMKGLEKEKGWDNEGTDLVMFESTING